MVGVAVNVTLVPEQIILSASLDAIVTLAAITVKELVPTYVLETEPEGKVE